MTDRPAPLFDADLGAFMEGGVSISVAASDRENMPALVRALGCSIAPDRRRVKIFVSATQAGRLLQCIRDNGAVAVVFSQPSTHRAVQLKGMDGEVRSLEEGDLQSIRAYREAFAREVEPLGFEKSLIRTLLACPPSDLAALCFTPAEAFTQTPGPQAGSRLKAGT